MHRGFEVCVSDSDCGNGMVYTVGSMSTVYSTRSQTDIKAGFDGKMICSYI